MIELLLIIRLLIITIGLIGCSLFAIIRAINKSNLSLTFTNISHHLENKDSIDSAMNYCSKNRANELMELELRIRDRQRRLDEKLDLIIELIKSS